jgi:aminopeptidase N
MRILVLAAVVLCGSIAAAASPPGPIDVLHYDVSIDINFDTHEIEGRTAIDLRARSAGQDRLQFSANSLRIESVTLGDRPLTAIMKDGALVVDLPRPLRAGERAKVTFTYKGPSARGLVFNGASVYAGYFACDWMICNLDDFGEKASIDLELHAPKGMISQGPGVLKKRSILPDGSERLLWRETRPYSAYLFGFALGNFKQAKAQAGRTELIYLSSTAEPERLQSLFAPTANMMEFLQRKAGVPFPHARYVQVHTPGSDAQEASNFAAIGEQVIAPRLLDPQEDWAIVHELAHQWWGNSITCTDISQFWLNEGITTFMVAAWKENRWGRAAYERELSLLQGRLDTIKRAGGDHPLTYAGPYPSLSARRAIQYSKGALFMDRLRRELGDDAFWAGLKRYTRDHVGSVVDSRDFQTSMEQSAHRDLSALFNEWVYE